MAMLKDKVNKDEEREFSLESNVFLRPPLKQIGNSIFEIKQYFTSDVGLKIVPSSFISPLKRIKDDLFKCLSEDRFLSSVDLVTGDEICNIPKQGFVFLAESLALALDFPVSHGREYVKCDSFIALPHQPVLVLTLVDGGEETREARLYNSSVARGVTKSLRRFMSESVNVVFGTLLLTDLKDVLLFEEKIKLLAERCSLAVTEKSLSMAPNKYNKTLVAFWAAVSEIKSFAHGTGNSDEDYIHFLTKDQCIVLVENINSIEVDVTSEPGCGGTTLMFEVAKRLSRLGETLLVCRSVEEQDRLKPLPSVTSKSKEVSTTEMCAFEHIVDGIGTMKCQTGGRLWHFKRSKEIIHEMATMKTPQVGVMMLSEETQHLMDKVNDLEQTMITGNGLSQTDWFSVQRVINRLPIIEKHKDNREKLIPLLTSADRQWRVNHLIQELNTLKLMDTLINLHSTLPLMAAAFMEPRKKQRPSHEDRDTEGRQHDEMSEQLQKGLRKRGDLFPVLKTAIQEDNKAIFYLQAKADYLLQEMSMEGEIGFWEPTRDKRQSELNERVNSEVGPVKENRKQLIRDQPEGQVKQSAIEAVISRNNVSSPEEDYEAKANITDLDLKNIWQTKESLEKLKREIDSQNEDLSKHSTEDRSEWESKLELLSMEIPALSIHPLITDVIGHEVIPELAEQSQTPDILKEPAANTNHQRRGRGNRVRQLRQFEHGNLTHRNILDILDNVIRDNMESLIYCNEKATHFERVYGSPVYIITEYGSSRSNLLSCPVMKLDKSRVNTDWFHVSTDGGTLVSTPDRGQYNTDSGQYNTDRFRRYWGTCSSPPIPLPPSPSTLTAPRYWESHTRLSVTGQVYGWTLLEMGICGVGEVDTGYWVSEQTRSSWTVCVVECDTHRDRYCTQVWEEGRQVGGCYNTKSITHNTTVVYKYGVVLDVERGRVAFLDLDRDIVMEKMDVRITQPLRAMFGVWPRDIVFGSDCDIQMRLVSGGEIAMTDNKQSLIYKALSV